MFNLTQIQNTAPIMLIIPSVLDMFNLTQIQNNIISWTKKVVANYKVSDILGSERANVNAALTDYLNKKFEPYGIAISNVSLINISVDEKTQEAINAKITAQQAAETQEINNQTAINKCRSN